MRFRRWLAERLLSKGESVITDDQRFQLEEHLNSKLAQAEERHRRNLDREKSKIVDIIGRLRGLEVHARGGPAQRVAFTVEVDPTLFFMSRDSRYLAGLMASEVHRIIASTDFQVVAASLDGARIYPVQEAPYTEERGGRL